VVVNLLYEQNDKYCAINLKKKWNIFFTFDLAIFKKEISLVPFPLIKLFCISQNVNVAKCLNY